MNFVERRNLLRWFSPAPPRLPLLLTLVLVCVSFHTPCPGLSCPVLSCPQSPKAVLGNRFIVVDLSEANLIDVDRHYQGQDAGETAAAEEVAAKAAAAAAQAARKKAQEREKLIVSYSDVVIFPLFL